MIFGPPCHPPRGTHISASRALIKNRLDESANLAQRGIHAKFQPNSTSRLARAMGRVRFLTSHFIIGGCLYILYYCILTFWLPRKSTEELVLFIGGFFAQRKTFTMFGLMKDERKRIKTKKSRYTWFNSLFINVETKSGPG